VNNLRKPGLGNDSDTQQSWLSDLTQPADDSAGQWAPAGFSLFSATIATVTTATASSASSFVTPASSSKAISATPAASWIASLNDTVLRSDMAAASAGGTVTEAGMAQLFTDLATELTTNKTTLSASQFTDLKLIATDLNVGETASAYLTYVVGALINGSTSNTWWTGGGATAVALGNLAAGATAAKVTELDGKWLLGSDLPSSKVSMSGVAAFSVSYSAVSNAVFAATGPSMNDINQGYLGDCYLLSALAEVAKQDPSAIQSMITDNGNNTYGVRFFINGTAQYVTVNNQLPDGGTIFNSATNDWASLVEKAYAQVQASGLIPTGNTINAGNSFSTIGNGGAPEYTLEEITGASAITDFYANGSSWVQYVYNNALRAVSAVGGVSTASVLSALVTDIGKGFDVILSSMTNASVSGKETLIADHAMSVYGYDSATGNLEIRNPWGSMSGQYWSTTFEVSLTTLLADGDTISADNNAVSSAPSVVTGALVSAAAGLQANAAISAFSVSDTAANVTAALSTLGADAKLTSIALTDASVPTITLASALYSADTAVLAKISSPYHLTVTGAPVSVAAALQSASLVTSFTLSDSSANLVANIATLNADTKLTAVTLTDTNALSLTYAQFTADTAVLGKLPTAYTVTVSGVTAANAATLQANSHVASFTISDTAANVTAALTSLNADSKLASLTVSGTTTADTLTLTGSKAAATINLNGDTASVSAGLSAASLSFIGTPDAITLGTGAAIIDFTLQPAGGIETIANFQYGHDQLVINLSGAANSVLMAANTTVAGSHAISIYSSANPTHGVVLLGMSSTLTASNLLSAHTTFSGGQAVIS